MRNTWFAPERLFDGQSVLTGHAVRVADGQVREVGKATPQMPVLKGCLTPGFVDLQVNGGGGVMVNTTPTAQAMAQIAAAHHRFGTVGLLPTVITDAPEVLEQAAEAAIAAKGEPGILGLHIEGPHIALARRGTHNAAHVRPMDDTTMAVVAKLRRNDIAVLITLAPEVATETQISSLVEVGAVVSLGHTDATSDWIEAAISAGATCATHLFNAMSPMTSREPGAVGAILNSRVRSGIICDGYHVDDRMIQLALRARPADDLIFIVSDAMATVGGPSHFELYGQRVHLEGGRLINAEGNLAGAHFTQKEGVARLVHRIGVSLDVALRMAVTIPATVIGQPRLGQLVGRDLGDVILLSEDLQTTDPLSDIYAAHRANDAAE